jgi:pimeloyl-ACP methyl ester carboxylesterase
MHAMGEIKIEAHDLTFSAYSSGDGPVVLCLHGFPDNLRSFRHQLPALAEAGFRAIAPALRGYEPSSQPGPEIHHYHPRRVAADAIAWAESHGKVHLIGHDWGGVAAYQAAAERPDLFHSLSVIAIPHTSALGQRAARRLLLGQLRKSWYGLFFQLRGIADRVVERKDFAFIEFLWREWSPGYTPEPGELESVKQTLRQPGVLSAALAYYRAMLSPGLDDSRAMRKFGGQPIRVPTLAITGVLDGCMDTRFFDHVPTDRFPEGLRTERVDGAGHFVHQEDPDRINALLVEWLNEHTE